MIAEIYIIKNNRFRAIEYLETSVKINKEQPDTLVRLGEQYEYFLNDREAAAQFRLALSYDPEHIKANAFIVRHYINEGDTEAADRHFSISYEKGRKAVKILSERAYRAGIDKDYDEAVRLYEIIIERAPAFKDAYFHVHDIARFTGQPEISVSVLEKYKRIRPDYARGYYLLGIIYFDEKLPGNRKYNIDRAIRNLERAVEINPGYAAAHYQLSGIYRILKDDIRAEEHFRLAREAEK